MLDQVFHAIDRADEEILSRVFQPVNDLLLGKLGWLSYHTARLLMWLGGCVFWVTIGIGLLPSLYGAGMLLPVPVVLAAVVFYYRVLAHDRYLASMAAAEATRLKLRGTAADESVYEGGAWTLARRYAILGGAAGLLVFGLHAGTRAIGLGLATGLCGLAAAGYLALCENRQGLARDIDADPFIAKVRRLLHRDVPRRK